MENPGPRELSVDPVKHIIQHRHIVAKILTDFSCAAASFQSFRQADNALRSCATALAKVQECVLDVGDEQGVGSDWPVTACRTSKLVAACLSSD